MRIEVVLASRGSGAAAPCTWSIPVEEVLVTWHDVPGSKPNVVRDSLQILRDLLVLRANQLLGQLNTREEDGGKLKAE